MTAASAPKERAVHESALDALVGFGPGAAGRVIYGCAVAFSAFQLYTAAFSPLPSIVLRYTSFKQITDDISDARVYGGIHFRTDQTAGTRLGKAIAITVYKNNLRRKLDDRDGHLQTTRHPCPTMW